MPAFDAGWNAHEQGIARETVMLAPPSGRRLALLGWDVRRIWVPGDAEELERADG